MRTYVVAVVISLLVSAAVGCWLLAGGRIGSFWPFFLSPGLLAYAATSDVLSKPPVYQTAALFAAMNTAWYLLVALLARGASWAIRGGLSFVSPQNHML